MTFKLKHLVTAVSAISLAACGGSVKIDNLNTPPTDDPSASSTVTPSLTATAVGQTATPSLTATAVGQTATPSLTATTVEQTATPSLTATTVGQTATPSLTATAVEQTATPSLTATAVGQTATPSLTATPVEQTPTLTATPTSQPTVSASITSVVTTVVTTTLVPSEVATSSCGDVPVWSGGIGEAGDQVEYNNHLWQLTTSGFAAYPPGEGAGATYWTDLGECGSSSTTTTMVPSPTTVVTTAPTPSATLTPTATPSITPTDAISNTVTMTPTATPTTSPTQVAGLWCPSDDSYDASATYQANSSVFYQGHSFIAGGYVEAGTIPTIGVTSGTYNVWLDQGVIDPAWCDGKAVDTAGRELSMSNWPVTLKRNWKNYDQSSGKHVGAYFVEWSIYDRVFSTKDVPWDSLTHVYFAFVTVCGDNSTAYNEGAANDGWCQHEYAGDSKNRINIYDENATTNQAFGEDYSNSPYPASEDLFYKPGAFRGMLAEFTRAKAAYPHVKIIPSVGGWTLSRPFYEMAETDAGRKAFAESVKKFLLMYLTTFDGIDIDWEFPGGGGNDTDKGNATTGIQGKNAAVSVDGVNFGLLMVELRKALTEIEQETGKYMELSAATAQDSVRLGYIDWEVAAKEMDSINIMSYDFYGAWNNVIGHQTSLHFDVTDPDIRTNRENWNAATATQVLLDRGVPAHKVVMGVGAYGRGWQKVGTAVDAFDDGQNDFGYESATAEAIPVGTVVAHSSGTGNVSHWEAGIADYAYIRQEYMTSHNQGKGDWQYHYDADIGAAWVFNPSLNGGTLLTMDSRETVLQKAQYIRDNNLGGLFMWEIDGDDGDILNAMNEGLGNNLQ